MDPNVLHVCITICTVRWGKTKTAVESGEATQTEMDPGTTTAPVVQDPEGEPEYDPETGNWYKSDCFRVCDFVTINPPQTLTLTVLIGNPCGGNAVPISHSAP